jgi:hypothetical protein
MVSWRDDIRKVAGTFYDAGREVLLEGAASVNNWTEQRGADRKMSDLDDRMNKAADDALASGNDGTHNPAREQKAIGFDPFDLVSLMGWRERPSALSFTAMEATATGVPVVADVVRTRATQVQTFCKRPEDRHSPGFKVRPRDQSVEITPEIEKKSIEYEDLLLRTGYHDPDRPQDDTTLRDFCGVFIKDSLTFDQAVFEVVPDRTGRPSYFAIVDPATIRLVDPVLRKDAQDPFAVQVLHGAIITDFLPDELAFCIRNPRSGIRTFGYGLSEVETLVREITGFLWGIEYNRRFFSQGSATKGILNFKGTIPDKHLQSFRRQWYSMVAGVHNSWRTPITNAEELQWINLQMSSRDMEMGAWMDFLIKIVCARFQIAPEEVNFSYGNTGQSQAMGNVSVEDKLKASKDLGLRPLVQFFFDCINTYFLQRIDPDFEAVPIGLDAKGPEAEIDLLQKQTHVFLTVNEAREIAGLEPMPEKQGDCLLDPTWLQYTQGQQAMEGGEDGEGGDEAGGGDDDEDDNPFGVNFPDDDDGDDDANADDNEDDNSGPQDLEQPVAKSAVPGVLSSRKSVPVVRYEIDVDI